MIDPASKLARTYIGEYPYGQSVPQLFIIEEVGHCLVKFQQNPQGERILINELVGFNLATLLGIEHPQVGIVEIDKDLLPSNGVLETKSRGGDPVTFQAGLHFYSKFWSKNVSRVSPEDFQGLTIANGEMLGAIILLDILLNNWDRSESNMNLLLRRENEQHRIKLIDLGNAFGGGGLWTLGNLNDTSFIPLENPLPYESGLQSYLNYIHPQRDFEPVLEKLGGINHSFLKEILNDIPVEWGLTPDEEAALIKFLESRVNNLP